MTIRRVLAVAAALAAILGATAGTGASIAFADNGVLHGNNVHPADNGVIHGY
jgi:hypothetical protein